MHHGPEHNMLGLLRRKEGAERTIIKDDEREKERLTFLEKVAKLRSEKEEELDNIILSGRMTAIANNLLEAHGIQRLMVIPEDELAKQCDPYDPVVILALCQKLAQNKKESN